MDKKVYVHLAEGFEEIEAMATIDILIRGELDVEIVSVTGERIVKSVRGIGVQCDKLFEEVDYSEGLHGAQFVIRNPNAKTTCGCGSSFSV